MRKSLVFLALMAPVGCADAPITHAHLAPDGQLQPIAHAQSAFAVEARATPRRAVQITAVLAAEYAGPLQDSAEFAADVGYVHLHLRADSLSIARPVTFVWTFDGERDETVGVLAPAETLGWAASHKVAPSQTGDWRVEVFGEPQSPADAPELLFKREFQVL